MPTIRYSGMLLTMKNEETASVCYTPHRNIIPLAFLRIGRPFLYCQIWMSRKFGKDAKLLIFAESAATRKEAFRKKLLNLNMTSLMQQEKSIQVIVTHRRYNYITAIHNIESH